LLLDLLFDPLLDLLLDLLLELPKPVKPLKPESLLRSSKIPELRLLNFLGLVETIPDI